MPRFSKAELRGWLESTFFSLFLGPDSTGWTVVSDHGQFAGRMDNVNDSCRSSNVVSIAGLCDANKGSLLVISAEFARDYGSQQ